MFCSLYLIVELDIYGLLPNITVISKHIHKSLTIESVVKELLLGRILF